MLDALLADDAHVRRDALAALPGVPEHTRSSLAGKLAPMAKDAAAGLGVANGTGAATDDAAERLARTIVALAHLRVETAKSCLLRISDDESSAVKIAIARALGGATTAEGRAVLLHLLSDDGARADAIEAIGVAPWPEVLPCLIEIAEADDDAIAIASMPIAKCGAAGGTNEAHAAVDFLCEFLDDDVHAISAAEALLAHGIALPAIPKVAERLREQAGPRRLIGLALLAAFGDDTASHRAELLFLGASKDPAEGALVKRLIHALDTPAANPQ